MPLFPEINDVIHCTSEERRVAQKVELSTLFNSISGFVSNNDIPAKVEIDNLVTKKSFWKGTPLEKGAQCITIVHRQKSDSYLSFGIVAEFEYGTTYIKLFLYGRSRFASLRERRSDEDDYKYRQRLARYQQEWDAEQRYYGAVKWAFNGMFE
jgi:hypothetical protein